MRVAWSALDLPYRGGHFTISAEASTRARTVLVAGRGADGTTGHGEAVPSRRVTGHDSDVIHGRLQEAAHLLEAVDVTPEDRPPASPFDRVQGPAACAIDGMLLDLWAQAHEKPLWRLLDMPRPDVATSATVSLGTGAAMAREAIGHMEAGFRILKVKLGEGVDGDIARLDAIREAAPRATIRVDGNEGWTPGDMRRILPRLADAGVELVEQPLRRDVAEDAMRTLTDLCGEHEIAHVLDERVHGPEDAATIAERRLAHGINLKLQKAGGLTNGLRVIETARDHGLGVMIGCFIETWAGIALALQPCAHVDWVDLDGAWLLGEEPVQAVDRPFLREGRLHGSDAPGIGVAAGPRLAGLFDEPTTSL